MFLGQEDQAASLMVGRYRTNNGEKVFREVETHKYFREHTNESSACRDNPRAFVCAFVHQKKSGCYSHSVLVYRAFFLAQDFAE